VKAGMLIRVLVGIIVLATYPLWAQVAASGADAGSTSASGGGGGMLTPAPISGEGYSMGFTSETRANYLRGGLIFSTAYDSDATTGANGQAVSDVSYSIWPTISLDQTRSRFHWTLSYTPGYTFYQRSTSLDSANQNFALGLKYRLSPHVTLSLQDSFVKTSSILNQANPVAESTVSGAVSVPNDSVIAPIADVLTNNANVTLTYQFSANGMIGASGTFTNLHYPNQTQVPGLFDSSSRGGSAFYNHRLSKMHYIGATYQYQTFFSYPNGGQSETQAQSIFLFYTLYFKPTLSLSLFGGPQYSDTQQFGLPPVRSWSPAGGASFAWRGKLTSFAASYSQTINGGGGLVGAVHSYGLNASVRRQLTRTLTAAIAANYANNKVLDAQPGFDNSGHTISGSASLQRQIGQNLNAGVQYTRVHQSYTDVPAISGTPDHNRVAVTISYQFSRPLGR
jgi:hypothetical protein